MFFMFVSFLTFTLFLLTESLQDENAKYRSRNHTQQPEKDPYNINSYINTLNLQTCAFVAVGLKYFAIFVEDYPVLANQKTFFLGMCHYDTLKDWNLCSPQLSKVNPHKCRIKLSKKRYQQRVQRRFCDIKVMLENPECICIETLFGDVMHKVVGFPTCYIPLLPASLCKYNVCGLAHCNASTEENAIHSVHCDPECKGGRPFCEYPLKGLTQETPEITSIWSKWKNVQTIHYAGVRLEKSISKCVNIMTRKPGFDCLGPGTHCCPYSLDIANCTCHTNFVNGRLIAERNIYFYEYEVSANPIREEDYSLQKRLTGRLGAQYVELKRRKRGGVDYDIDDDDDHNDDDVEEDIVLEDNVNEEQFGTTTESLEKDEIHEEMQREASVSETNVFNDTQLTNSTSIDTLRHKYVYLICGILLFIMF